MVVAALCMALHPQRRRRRRPDEVTNQNVRSNRGDIVLDGFLGSGTTLVPVVNSIVLAVD
jgi:hypothetical protein